jgi:hypothetical protein
VELGFSITDVHTKGGPSCQAALRPGEESTAVAAAAYWR